MNRENSRSERKRDRLFFRELPSRQSHEYGSGRALQHFIASVNSLQDLAFATDPTSYISTRHTSQCGKLVYLLYSVCLVCLVQRTRIQKYDRLDPSALSRVAYS